MGTSTTTIITEGGAKIAKCTATFIKIRLQSILELAYNWQKCKGSHNYEIYCSITAAGAGMANHRKFEY